MDHIVKKDNFILKKTSIVLFSNFVSQVMSFIVVLLITRALTVEDYAKFVILNTFLTLIIDLADMGINGSTTRFVAQYHNNSKIIETKIIYYSIKRKIIACCIVMPLMIILSSFIAKYFIHDSTFNIYIIMTSFCCVLSLFLTLNHAIFQGRQNYLIIFVCIVFDSALYLTSIGLLYFFNYISILTIVLSVIFHTFVSLVITSIVGKFKLRIMYKKIKISSALKSKYSYFGFWLLVWAIFANLQSRTDFFLLSILTTPDQISFYDLANKFTKPALMMLSAFTVVLNPIFARITDYNELKKSVVIVCKFVLVISIFLGFCILISDYAICFFFGDKYLNAVTPTKIMLISLIFYIWTAPFNCALYALNKPHIFALTAGLGFIFVTILDLLLLKKYGAIGASVTFLLNQILALLVSAFFFFKNNKSF